MERTGPQYELRVTIIELEQTLGSVLQQHSWWLFFQVEGQKTRAKKDGVWHETVTVPAEGRLLTISLYAWGRIKHELLAQVELSVENIKTLVLAGYDGNIMLQRQCDFWFDCKAQQTTICQVRIAFELALTPSHLKDRMRALLRPLIGVPVSEEMVSFASAGRPLDESMAEDEDDDEKTDKGGEAANDSSTAGAPVSSKLFMAYESAYGSYGGTAERGERADRGYVSFEDPVVTMMEKAPDTPQYQFNNQWQGQISGLLFGKEHAAKEGFSFEKIADLSISFVKQAEHFAKTIVMERSLPVKTIKPIASLGVLGGLKYCVNGIFFKLAEDPLGIGPENACKGTWSELLVSSFSQPQQWLGSS
jgi:hypothetical protein